jgi:hypothetical protein
MTKFAVFFSAIFSKIAVLMLKFASVCMFAIALRIEGAKRKGLRHEI